MKKKIDKFLQEKSLITKELKEWCDNKDIPLEERWEVFTKSELGTIQPFINNEVAYIVTGDKHEFGFLSYPKNSLVDLVYILNEEHIWKDPEEYFTTVEVLTKLKEYCLNNFIRGFYYDW